MQRDFRSLDELYEEMDREVDQIIIQGTLRKSDKSGHFEISPDYCVSWLEIPANLIVNIQYLAQFACHSVDGGDHIHPLVRVFLAQEVTNDVPNIELIARLADSIAGDSINIGLRNTYFNVEGEAGQDVSAWFDGRCFWGENIGSRRLRLHLGPYSKVLNRGQRHRFLTFGNQCFSAYGGRTFAVYV